jgi:hypothetical protein
MNTESQSQAILRHMRSGYEITSLEALKLPHHYAAAYLQASSKDAQAAALKGCPTEWQELVKTHIKNQRERADHESKQLQSNGTAADRKRGAVVGGNR